MALGESRTALVEIILRELTRAGEGAVEPALARRIAEALAQAMEDNNSLIELKLTQKLQTSGLHA